MRKEGNVLFNDTLNTFYLWLYGVSTDVRNSPMGLTWINPEQTLTTDHEHLIMV